MHSDTPTVRDKSDGGTLMAVLIAAVLILPDIILLFHLLKPKNDDDQCQKS